MVGIIFARDALQATLGEAKSDEALLQARPDAR